MRSICADPAIMPDFHSFHHGWRGGKEERTGRREGRGGEGGGFQEMERGTTDPESQLDHCKAAQQAQTCDTLFAFSNTFSLLTQPADPKLMTLHCGNMVALLPASITRQTCLKSISGLRVVAKRPMV